MSSEDGISTSNLSPGISWPRPRTPLPPHRLAKLANALGVSTPQPAMGSASIGYFSNGVPSMDRGKSPTPSSSSAPPTSQHSTSKFLLHVIPPSHLPHDSETSEEKSLTPLPNSASGYHSHFRRGTLVPFHSTIQSQMSAIAKEYALPSTAGLVLYLVSGMSSSTSDDGLPSQDRLNDDEPGPRLSPEIWRHLWNRVAMTEHSEDTSDANATPLISHTRPNGQSSSEVQPLRPLFSSASLNNNSKISSTATPSSIMTSNFASSSKSPRNDSWSQPSEPESPNTSEWGHQNPPQIVDPRAMALALPGLKSPSFIPILCKVEFDIDKRRAPWYEPWIQSRRLNQQKRGKTLAGSPAQTNGASSKLIPLQLGAKQKQLNGSHKFLLENGRITDSPEPSEFEQDNARVYMSPDDLEFYDMGDLGYQEYDENDFDLDRQNQYLMKAKLDEIEKTLRQFSPQQSPSAPTNGRSPPSPLRHGGSNSNLPYTMSSTDSESPSLSLDAQLVDVKRTRRSTIRYQGVDETMAPPTRALHTGKTPSKLNLEPPSSQRGLGITPPLTPTLAVNGINTDVSGRRSDRGSPVPPSPSSYQPSVSESSLSTVTAATSAQPTSSELSRFSLDSNKSDEQNRGAKQLNGTIGNKSVKTMKNLWRKSTGKKNNGPLPGQLQISAPMNGNKGGPFPPPSPAFSQNGGRSPVEGRSKPVNHFYYDDDVPFPTHPPRPRPSLSSENSSSAISPPPLSPLSPAPSDQTAPKEKRSMMKMFKSSSPSTLNPPQDARRPSVERTSSEQQRNRKPTLLETQQPKRLMADGQQPPSPFTMGSWGRM